MKKISYIAILTTIIFGCISKTKQDSVIANTSDEPAKAELIIGNGLDRDYSTAYGSDVFNLNDSFAYSFYYPDSFKTTQILLRISKIEGNGERTVLSNYTDVDPDNNNLYNISSVNPLYDEFGKGKFKLSIISIDSVIGRDTFNFK